MALSRKDRMRLNYIAWLSHNEGHKKISFYEFDELMEGYVEWLDEQTSNQ